MDRLEAMSLLVAAVETGSFSAAGRKLGVPLATLSRKVADLEAHVNARLLVRTTRKSTLTEAGAAYLEACRRILEQVAEAERTASGEFSAPRGELVVTAPVVFGRMHLLPLVNEFLAQYPDVNVRLVLADRTLNMFQEHIDVAVRIGTLPDSNLIATRLGTVSRVVCGSPRYFAAHGTPTKLADLAAHACISFEGLAQGAAWRFSRPESHSGKTVAIKPRLVVNNAEAAVDAAIAGVGLAHVLSYQAWPAYKAGKLQLVLRRFAPDPVPVSVVHMRQGLVPAKVRCFVDFAVPRLRKAIEHLTRRNPPGLASPDSPDVAYA